MADIHTEGGREREKYVSISTGAVRFYPLGSMERGEICSNLDVVVNW